MFQQALATLSSSDIHALAAKGVPHTRVSEWKKGKRLPTRTQALALSMVKQLDFGKLEYELAMIEAEKDAGRNAGFAALIAQVQKL
jgi:ribosomal protein L32